LHSPCYRRLRELQDIRKRQAKACLDEAAYQYIAAVHDGPYHTFDPAAVSARISKNGFEFSLAEIEVRAMEIDPNLFANYGATHARSRLTEAACGAGC
jgi:hypothetical protein